MNEKLSFRLTQNGRPLQLDQIVSVEDDRGGLIVNGETSAWPRGLRFGLEGVGAFNAKLNKLRNEQAGGDHRFNVVVENDSVSFTTLSPSAIPIGTYDYRIRIADLDIEKTEGRVKIQNGVTVTEVTLEVNPEPFRVALTESLQDDLAIAALVNGESLLDGKKIIEWLGQTGLIAPRVKRKACLLNLLAKLSATPSETDPLIKHVRKIFFVDPDRIYAKVDVGLLNQLRDLDADTNQPFSMDSGTLHPTHLKILRRIPNEDQDASERYTLVSFREDAQPSLQITIAIPPDDRPRSFYADIDIDLGNPVRDLAGFFIHLGELVAEGKTDHIKLNKRLKQDQVLSKHLHYTITRL